MKLNNGLLFSTVTLALMATGCVKKQENITASGTYNAPANGTYNAQTNGVYNPSPANGTVTYDPSINNSTGTTTYDPSMSTVGTTTYDPSINTGGTTTYEPAITNIETAPPLVYDTTSGAINNATTGGYSEVVPDNTVITTTSGSSNSGEIVDNYNDAYSSGAFSTNRRGGGGNSSTYNSSNNAYSGYGETTDYSSTGTNSSYSHSNATPTASVGGGIHLQIAALKDYYAAQEFKNSLSLDPKYSAYIKRGPINKVIISGISSVAEANRLKERRFPGAFIVRNSGGGSASPSSYSPTPTPTYSDSSRRSSSSSSYSGGYSDNSAYGGYTASSSSSASSGSIGVQIGAFSSRSKAQTVANANSGHYHAIVEEGRSRGKRIYRVILTGFSSRSDAKRALASGRIPKGFVTTIH